LSNKKIFKPFFSKKFKKAPGELSPRVAPQKLPGVSSGRLLQGFARSAPGSFWGLLLALYSSRELLD